MFVALQRRNTARTFRRAMRHSRRVRFLRVAIPIGAACAVSGAVLFAWIDPLRMFTSLPISLGDLIISGTKIKMEQPRLSGYTRDQRPYDLTATSAAQDITKPDLIELTGLRAKMRMQDKTTLEMTAVTGLFNSKSEVLQLDKDIVVNSTGGLKGHLSEAMVDTKKGHLTSNKPVKFVTDRASISANSMEVIGSGDVISFKGKVSVDLTRPILPSAAAQKAATQ